MPKVDNYDVYSLSGSGTAVSPFKIAAHEVASLTSVSIADVDPNSGSTKFLGDVPFDSFSEGSGTLGSLLYVGYIKYTPPVTVGHPHPTAVTAAVGEDKNGVYYMFVAANTSPATIDDETYKFIKSSSTKPATRWAINREAVNCFVSNTLISTALGDRAVEELRAGDIVLTFDGDQKAIRWVGSTVVAFKFADPIRAWPIRIKAGALAENVPSRDLLVSPGHAVLVDDLLVQARALVNGISVVRETSMPMTFSYYHVEVDSHVLLMAENTPCESFLEATSDVRLDNSHERATLPGAASHTEMDYPRVKAARQLPRSVRATLEARSALFSAASIESSVQVSALREGRQAA